MKYRVSVKFHRDFIDVDEEEKEITIGVKAKPTKGKANREIIKKIADYFGVSSAYVHIVHGGKSRKKMVEIIKE